MLKKIVLNLNLNLLIYNNTTVYMHYIITTHLHVQVRRTILLCLSYPYATLLLKSLAQTFAFKSPRRNRSEQHY